jgi:chromosome segregation ATPase
MGSEGFARMAAQQMAIRQQLQKMLSQLDAKEKEGLGGSGKLQEMQKQMEQTEKELFNKRLTQETINRQQDILTRLLESEKAEKKQEQDKKREAEQSKEKDRNAPPPVFNNYIDKKNKEAEILKTVPSELKPYYKTKANQYLKKAS